MKQSDFNYLNMCGNVLKSLDDNKKLWENNEDMVSIVNELAECQELINIKGANISGTNTTSYTVPKKECFRQTTKATYKLTRKMSAYAKVSNDAKLLPLVDLSLSTISAGIEKEALLRCKAIAKLAEEKLPALEKYKVTADEIAYIRQMADNCAEYSKQRGVAKSGKVNEGKSIGSLIKLMRQKFDILDDLVEGTIEDEAFIEQYKSLRIITDYGKGKTLKNKDNENENDKNVA